MEEVEAEVSLQNRKVSVTPRSEESEVIQISGSRRKLVTRQQRHPRAAALYRRAEDLISSTVSSLSRSVP